MASSSLNDKNVAEVGGAWMINNKGMPSVLLSLNGIKINTKNIKFLMANSVGSVAEGPAPADNKPTPKQ